jgi:hypothetical protein
MDDQVWDALGLIRQAIAETFPSVVVPSGAEDTIGAEARELASAIRQLGDISGYPRKEQAFEAGWQAACELGIARMSAYEEAAAAVREIEIMAESGATDPINRPGRGATK